ncbi:type IV pilin-like G/H family protein [Microcoleus sp. FACHB-672]|uniref:type IV pilin-like G/H family protein n=1 Tax=Microcoleus sp. FACHB-672 TaxID=2692825 RepID=UPI0016825D9D|nr:type IV pilin-like G/H family protein [Microcoleus sp. FACHB-672]MBD2040333.1 prepilin-type N-terminal cleavage/methylation domain-containing protein [Microcoleus sp. FACHB-672]
MKTEFKAKFLQHLNQKKQNEGFTLIELLVVVIIIGILAAIALPSLLSQTNKAKQAEARQNIGAMNRSQQAFYLEKQLFATNMADLGVGIKSQTENFIYSIPAAQATSSSVQNQAYAAGKANLKAYTGVVYTTITAAGGGGTTEALTQALLCESNGPQVAPYTAPTPAGGCVGGKDLGK